jgi:hypothetical protein
MKIRLNPAPNKHLLQFAKVASCFLDMPRPFDYRGIIAWIGMPQKAKEWKTN